MGAAMEGPMGDMGISPEMFDAAGDAFGAVAGPAMMGMPADASPGDMADCMGDCMEHIMPEGMDMPPEMGPMFDGMGDAMANMDMGPHDMGQEMMPDGMMDGMTDAGFVPGDPTSFPEGLWSS